MIAEQEIFKVAADLPFAERAAYLDSACASESELRTRVEELLRSHDVKDFMADSTLESRESAIGVEFAGLKIEVPGERIDRYTLIEQIGQGGCGTVWIADQDQPVQRRVAL